MTLGPQVLGSSLGRLLRTIAVCLSILFFGNCAGQGQVASDKPKTDDATPGLVQAFRDTFPNTSARKPEAKFAFRDTQEYRRAVSHAVTEGPPRENSEIVRAYLDSDMGMTYGNSVSLNAILCDDHEATLKIENEILNLVTSRHFRVVHGWNEAGFIGLISHEANNIFTSPSRWEDASLLIKLDRRPGDNYGLVTFIYDVKAGLRANDPSSFSDQTNSREVEEYMGGLTEAVRSIAIGAIRVNCTKVSSGATTSEADARRRVNNRLSKTQRDQLAVALQEKK